MPPFSGKKKKEQLQAKRQRKRDEAECIKARDRERELMREELINCGKDASDDVLDASLHGGVGLQGHATRGRRPGSGGNKVDTAGTSTYLNICRSASDRKDKCDSGRSSSGDSGHKREDEKRCSVPSTVMYSADRRHGVRSVFARESADAIAARKQLSYQPIPYRTTIPPTGIAFGDWFTFPSSASSVTGSGSTVSQCQTCKCANPRASGRDTFMSTEEKSACAIAEQERRMNRPLVASAGDALGGVTSSIFFPLAVELPSRGWHVDHESGALCSESSKVTIGNWDTSKQLNSDTLNADIARDALRSPASLSAQGEPENRAHALHTALSRGEAADLEKSAEASVADANTTLGENHRYDARLVKSVEWKRFGLYTECVDAYPLPASLTGLEVSSYERNLEVWQQLWRTVEISDVVVVVADARYPIIHTHLGLLTYIVKEQQKSCVLVLNKEDLVPSSTLRCWKQFLYRYLDDLGFAVEPPDATEQPSKKNSTQGHQDSAAHVNPASGCIVLRTFTANPRPETVGLQNDEVDVTRRHKERRKPRAHMYEQLRTGQINVAKHLGDGSDDEEEDALRYSSTEHFVGMEAAQRALQQDRRAYTELQVVAAKITELLATCRRLAAPPSRRSVQQEYCRTPEESNTAPSSSQVTTKSPLPCAAPRAARKEKKTHKKLAARCRGANRSDGRFDDLAGDCSDNDSSDVVAECRAPDCSSLLRIGFVGHPNVGKSSLLNCICGTKVVSVSATPGHTKHLQTIPVPEQHLTLVDSPGLALPVFGVPRPLQAVLGTHQIAQTRDPQTSISFLAAYLPIEKMYGLQRPECALQETGWSSYELCEAYAKKRGLLVKRGKGSLDTHRAAIALLQEAYEGRITLFYAPPELNLLQSAWYRECIRPHLLLSVFKPTLTPVAGS